MTDLYNDTCVLCGFLMDDHTVLTNKFKISGRVTMKPIGWQCPEKKVEEVHTEKTLHKVAESLREIGLTEAMILDGITAMQNRGVLFRERDKDDPTPNLVRNNTIEPKSVVDLKLEDKDLASSVYTAISAASVCWEHMENTGVFQIDQARDIAEQLILRVYEIGRIYE